MTFRIMPLRKKKQADRTEENRAERRVLY